ncbi:MAG TPA: UDP-N-acetylglucosamine--N-acetylmuramyl-(pentapeptide) pyrophosphoryl-undecaprenol N-acetylglucosamine transferase [Actinomycetota bacterium]|nr:UDP-N-acetylglucosamine--N-acetylmuramyl-(pentapeptide) pyrophosphoryl-undecaprenol N-acetylglucosamine transferase [Actinomycetota bacterium]
MPAPLRQARRPGPAPKTLTEAREVGDPSLPGVVIAGGGTGGHGFVALALAEALVAEPARARVVLAGTTGGPEARAAAAAGIPFEGMDVIGFRRSLAPRDLPRNLSASARTGVATLRARVLLRRVHARVAVGCAGYASVPVAVAARLARVPLVVHEQNAVPGRATRLAAPWASVVAVSFPGTGEAGAPWARRWPRVVVTGNPVRPELAHLDRPALRPAAWEHFGLEAARRTLLVFGGSQGARHINQAALGAYDVWRDRADRQVLHLVGPKELPAAEAALAAERRPGDALVWRLVGFTDRMDLAYAAADLGVCRAGAATLFEIAATGLPCIVVPYPHAGAHQVRNAQPLVELDAVRLVLDADCTRDRLAAEVDGLLDDPPTLAAMSAALRGFAKPDAARDLADLVLEVAGR